MSSILIGLYTSAIHSGHLEKAISGWGGQAQILDFHLSDSIRLSIHWYYGYERTRQRSNSCFLLYWRLKETIERQCKISLSTQSVCIYGMRHRSLTNQTTLHVCRAQPFANWVLSRTWPRTLILEKKVRTSSSCARRLDGEMVEADSRDGNGCCILRLVVHIVSIAQ